MLTERSVDAKTFSSYAADLRQRHQLRLREGERDHLVYFALQSTAFTQLPPIEPALSAKEFVERLSRDDRARFLAGADAASRVVPRAVQARLDAFAKAVTDGSPDARVAYLRDVLAEEQLGRDSLKSFLRDRYVRGVRFLYDK